MGLPAMHLQRVGALCVALLPIALAIPAELQVQQCADGCWSQISSNRHAPKSRSSAGCTLQFQTTVIPCTVTTTSKTTTTLTRTAGHSVATSTATVTVPTTITRDEIALATAYVTTSTSEEVWLTKSSSAAAASSTTTAADGSGQSVDRRSVCTPQLIQTTTVPAYFPSCANLAAYSSACSCFGVAHGTVTAPAPTKVVSSTATVTSHVTLTPTTTTVVTRTVHKPIKLVTVTTASTTVTQGAVATQVCFDYFWYTPSLFNACPTASNGSVINYDAMAETAGAYFNYDNPGNTDPDHPPIISYLDGSLNNVDASNQCAALAADQPQPYLSFELSHLCEADQWRCNMFYGTNFDTSYWNVVATDAGTSFFFSNGFWASQGLQSYTCGFSE